MKKPFAFAASQRAARLSLGAAACIALWTACIPAHAQECPRGQIFWKSKKTCVDKAEAAKLGFYHGPVPAQGKANDKASDQAQPEKPADEAPSDANAAPPAPSPEATPQPAAVQPAEAAPPRQSPYGELVIEDFSKAK